MMNKKALAFIAGAALAIGSLGYSIRNDDIKLKNRWESSLTEAKEAVSRRDYQKAEELKDWATQSMISYRKDSLIGGLSFIDDKEVDRLKDEFSKVKTDY